MFPDPSSFSIPPILCISSGVPGKAQSRARSSLRIYGQKIPSPSSFVWLNSVVNTTGISGSEEGSGNSHGSELLAKYPSVRRMTGVR